MSSIRAFLDDKLVYCSWILMASHHPSRIVKDPVLTWKVFILPETKA
ncbi:MAG: hypothetical protein K2Z81_19780 [Cyanobacteria bacterium]|nr:hypothetical protein [Cyanobacteriota bacterium]